MKTNAYDSSDFPLGAVARNVGKPLPTLSPICEMTQARLERLFGGGPGVVETCSLPSRWMQSLHEEAERWDGLA